MTTAAKEDKAQNHYNIGWSPWTGRFVTRRTSFSTFDIFQRLLRVHSILFLLRLLKWIQWRCLIRFSTYEKDNRNSLVFSNPLIPVGTSRIDHIRSFGQWPCATSASFSYGPSSLWFGPTTDVLNDLQWYTQLDGIYRDSQGRCPTFQMPFVIIFFHCSFKTKGLDILYSFFVKGVKIGRWFLPLHYWMMYISFFSISLCVSDMHIVQNHKSGKECFERMLFGTKHV